MFYGFVDGNLGDAPVRRTYTNKRTNAEESIAVFSVASNKRFAREGDTGPTWVQVKVFGGQADPCIEHLYKGRPVAVRGEIEISKVPHKSLTNEDGSPVLMTYVEVNADQVDFLGPSKNGGEGNGAPAAQAQPQAAAAAGGSKLPF